MSSFLITLINVCAKRIRLKVDFFFTRFWSFEIKVVGSLKPIVPLKDMLGIVNNHEHCFINRCYPLTSSLKSGTFILCMNSLVSKMITFTKFKQICIYKSMYDISHVMRKPVYAICEQQRRRSACASAHPRSLISAFLFAGWIV